MSDAKPTSSPSKPAIEPHGPYWRRVRYALALLWLALRSTADVQFFSAMLKLAATLRPQMSIMVVPTRLVRHPAGTRAVPPVGGPHGLHTRPPGTTE